MKAPDYYKLIRPDRQRWAAGKYTCMVDGYTWNVYEPRSLETHEIERRSQAPKRWGRRVNYLRVCDQCHRDRIPSMTHAEQLALKWIHDPGQYNSLEALVNAWLRIKDPELRAPRRVAVFDVNLFVHMHRRAIIERERV